MPHLQTFWPDYNNKRSKELLSYNRPALRKLVGIQTGHCLLGKHARRLGFTNDDECRFCEDIGSTEDALHIVCEYPALMRRRYRFLGKHLLQEEQIHTLKLSSLKTFLDSLGDTERVNN